MRSHVITVFALVTILGLSASTYGADSEVQACEQALLTANGQREILSLARLSRLQMLLNYRTSNPKPLSQRQVFASLALSSAKFRKNIEAQGGWFSALFSSNTRDAVLINFARELIRHYSGSHLVELQNRSLHEELKVRGYSGQETSGREALDEISQRNLQRLLQPMQSQNGLIDARIERLVRSLRIFFVHNTVQLKNIAALPILSSAELRGLGFDGGLNTEAFNSQILKSDRNVFFRIYVVGPYGAFHAAVTEYGNTGLFLNTAYAEKAGWISPFVMYENELRKSVSGYFSEEQAEISSMRSADIVPLLNRMDFTVSDFRTLVEQKLAFELSRIQGESLERYEDAMQRLEGQNTASSGALIQTLVIQSLGFPTGVELKVPVAVPASEVKLR